jgi:class 3 adenylate cyclase/tetratricopeptide (TPR) repeat protein
MSKVAAARESLDSAKTVQELWRQRFDWIRDAERTCAFVKRAIREGDFLIAYDAAREALEEHHLKDIWLQQQMALALAQLGSTARAQAILKSLLEQEPENRETLGLLGRTYKDEWSADPANNKACDSALAWYQRAFEIEPSDYYPGINASALALLSDDHKRAGCLATEVVAICENKLKAPNPEELYWLQVTLAEALLILQRPEEAKRAYRHAATNDNVGLRELCSTRKQARLLAKHLYGQAEFFDECFPIPKLVIFSGHMMDSANRSGRRFAAADEPAVRSAIEKQLEVMSAGIGFSGAACGSDIIFLEAMLSRGAAVHVVLPWPKEQFVQTSVEIAAEGDWVTRFTRVLEHAASVRVLGEQQMPGTAIGLDYCNAVMIGLARLYARSLDLEIAPLAIWDGLLGEPGGTGSFVRYWHMHHIAPVVIPLRSSAAQAPSLNPDEQLESVEDDFQTWIRASGRYELKAIVFADITGYAKLTETAVQKFVAQFNRRVSCLVAETPHPPINVNTWGDAFFFAFNEVEHAGCFALDLRELVVATDWTKFGLPEDISIRIGVHAGPVYVTFDPVSRQSTFAGAHVVRAARIEPVTPRGEIFASEEFAALAAADEATGFNCDFIGTTELPKQYGSFRLYSLRRTPLAPGKYHGDPL